MDSATVQDIEDRLAVIDVQLQKAERGLVALARIQDQDAVTRQERQVRDRMRVLRTEAEVLKFLIRMGGPATP